LFTLWGGLDLAQVFLLNAWFMFCVFVLEVPTGTVADAFGRKTSLIAGSVVVVFAVALYVSYPNFWVFFAAEFLFAIAFTLHSGADEALFFDTLKTLHRENEATRLISRLEAFKLAGINLGALAGAVIAAHWSLRAPMALFSIPAVASIFIVLLVKEPPHVDAGADPKERQFSAIILKGGRYFIGHPAIRWITAELALTGLMGITLVWLYQPKLQSIGFSIAFFGVVQASGAFGQIVFLSRVETLKRWFGGQVNLLRISAALTAISYFLLAFCEALPIVLVAVIMGFSFSFPRLAIYSAEVHHRTPSSERATVLSFTSMCRTVVIFLVHPFTGWVASRSLSSALFLFGVLGTAMVFLAGRYERVESSENNQ
jgi:predicted MFS family arabinose efflux permease